MFSATRRLVQLFNIGLAPMTILSSKSAQQCLLVANGKLIHFTGSRTFSDKKDDSKSDTEHVRLDTELTLHTFENVQKKNKEAYLECLRIYERQSGKKRNVAEFLYAALKYLDNFGVSRDLECYKKLMDAFPKGKMIPTNIFQAEFLHYPKEQKCAVQILEKMEDNKVIPDSEVETIIRNTFGKHSIVMFKYWRIMYWMPKFKNLSPWPLPRPLPNDALELAKIAIWRMSIVDPQTKVSVFETETVKDSIDKTWIVSAMSPSQSKLLEEHQPRTKAIYVEGPFVNWVADKSVDYFVLLTKFAMEERKLPKFDLDDVSNLSWSFWSFGRDEIMTFYTVHEQLHETIFAMCATGTSSKDSLLSWIRHLQKENPILSKLPIVFTLKQAQSQKDVKCLDRMKEKDFSKMSEETRRKYYDNDISNRQ